MEVIKKYKLILIAVAVFAVLSFIYINYFSTDKEEPLFRGNQATGNVTVDEELLALLFSLQSIKINDEIFMSPEFKSLHDFSREITPEPLGRINPFSAFDSSASKNVR